MNLVMSAAASKKTSSGAIQTPHGPVLGVFRAFSSKPRMAVQVEEAPAKVEYKKCLTAETIES